MKLKTWIYFIVLTLMPTLLYAVEGQVDIELQADTTHIRIGEQIKLQLLVVDHDQKDLQISWPVYKDTLSRSIEVLRLMPVDTLSFGDETIYNQTWMVTSFDTGRHFIPAFEIFINGQEEETDRIEILVETVEVDTAEAIKNIKGVEDAPISVLDWLKYHWKWLVGLGVLVILIVGIYLIIRNKNKEIIYEEEVIEPILPPFEYAMERLDKLRDGKYWQSGDIKYYHSELSEILRQYMEREFSFPAMEQTTREVMRALRLTGVDAKQQKQMNRLLVLTDLVKYAKEKPLANENEEALQIAYSFLKETKEMNSGGDNEA